MQTEARALNLNHAVQFLAGREREMQLDFLDKLGAAQVAAGANRDGGPYEVLKVKNGIKRTIRRYLEAQGYDPDCFNIDAMMGSYPECQVRNGMIRHERAAMHRQNSRKTLAAIDGELQTKYGIESRFTYDEITWGRR